MSELEYGHFDSGPDDPRELKASYWAWYISQLITDGIRNGGTCLQVMPGGGMNVNIDAGMAMLQGYMVTLKEDTSGRYYAVTVPDANPQYPRIDRVVMRLNKTDLRTITPTVLTGTAAAAPAPPPLVRDDTNFDLSLAQVKVAANATALREADIVDERFNTELCGLLNSSLGLDPSVWQSQFEAFMAQMEADSNAEFDQFKDELTELTGDFTSDWQAWFAGIKSDPARYIQFNFDNLAALSGMTLSMPVPSGGGIMQTITNTADGTVMATRQTVKTDTQIQKTEVLYDADGTTELRRTVMTTTRGSAGITTVIT